MENTSTRGNTLRPMAKYRQNKGIETNQMAELIECSLPTVYRLERGGIVRRTLAARYLKVLEIDITNDTTYPNGLRIVDHGDRVEVHLDQ